MEMEMMESRAAENANDRVGDFLADAVTGDESNGNLRAEGEAPPHASREGGGRRLASRRGGQHALRPHLTED